MLYCTKRYSTPNLISTHAEYALPENRKSSYLHKKADLRMTGLFAAEREAKISKPVVTVRGIHIKHMRIRKYTMIRCDKGKEEIA